MRCAFGTQQSCRVGHDLTIWRVHCAHFGHPTPSYQPRNAAPLTSQQASAKHGAALPPPMLRSTCAPIFPPQPRPMRHLLCQPPVLLPSIFPPQPRPRPCTSRLAPLHLPSPAPCASRLAPLHLPSPAPSPPMHLPSRSPPSSLPGPVLLHIHLPSPTTHALSRSSAALATKREPKRRRCFWEKHKKKIEASSWSGFWVHCLALFWIMFLRRNWRAFQLYILERCAATPCLSHVFTPQKHLRAPLPKPNTGFAQGRVPQEFPAFSSTSQNGTAPSF